MNIITKIFRHHTESHTYKTLNIIAAAIIVASAIAPCVCAAPLSQSAKGAILIEASEGRVIYEYNADERLPMASTTKIMTALIAVECRELTDKITVKPAAVGVEGSSVYLKAGEELTMGDLVYALMLESANDAAAAIAIEISGSIEAFAEKMNTRARELHCYNTHFTNPHGLDNEEHYTTARDLAQITKVALENETFADIVSTYKHTIPTATGSGVRLLLNHNRLLRSSDYVIGVKTGFTKRSGRCLVSAAERDGVTVIAVTLSDPDDWRDHTAMLSYGLERYKYVSLAGDGELMYPVSVVGGDTAFITAVNKYPVNICVPADSVELRRVVSLQRFYFAPVAAGDVLGDISWYNDAGECVRSVPLIAAGSAVKPENKGFFAQIGDFFEQLF